MRSSSGRSASSSAYGKRPPNALRSHGQSTLVSVLSSPTTPMESSADRVKNAAGRRSARQSRSMYVAIQNASTSVSSSRIVQRPPVCRSSLTVQLSAPIQCIRSASKKRARAIVTSSEVVAKMAASTTNGTSGTCRCDHQKRRDCMRFRTTAWFRSAAARCRCCWSRARSPLVRPCGPPIGSVGTRDRCAGRCRGRSARCRGAGRARHP